MSPDRRQGVVDALDRARRAGRVRQAALTIPHAFVLPTSIADRLPLFGGAVILSFVVFDPRVVSAPQSVLDFLAAHEWGHVVRGDVAVTYLALLAYGGLTIAQRGFPALLPTALAALCTAILAGFLWRVLSPRRELDADAFAARIVGREAAADALSWLVAWRGGGWSAALLARQAALTR